MHPSNNPEIETEKRRVKRGISGDNIRKIIYRTRTRTEKRKEELGGSFAPPMRWKAEWRLSRQWNRQAFVYRLLARIPLQNVEHTRREAKELGVTTSSFKNITTTSPHDEIERRSRMEVVKAANGRGKLLFITYLQ